MEANRKRHIKTGAAYEYLFPKASGANATVRRNANVYHTVEFIPKVVKENAWQTKELSKLLKGNSPYETCRNIWQFVYDHIAYRKDADGYEQVRSPARAWHDRLKGVDCDCYTVFISSILWNLQIPHTLRITKYHRDYFQHIYPIVPLADGKNITIDCVVNEFNYEEPFSEKKDYPMDLQYLSGVGDLEGSDDGMELLGRVMKKRIQNLKTAPGKKPILNAKKFPGKSGKKNAPPVAPQESSSVAPAVYQPKKKKGLKKIISAANKVNPATVLLRNGLLASMKLNLMGAAQRLRWSYMSEDAAAKKGIDRNKHRKLVQVRNKLEKIFYTGGGKPINLRKAILGGKGNKDKAVNGLGWIDGLSGMDGLDYVDANTPLEQLLGSEIFHDENIAGLDGLGQLGEPISAAAIAAAASVVAAIAKNLKEIGSLFTKKTKDADNTDTPIEISDNPGSTLPVVNTETTPPTQEQKAAVQSEISKASEETTVQPGQTVTKVNLPAVTSESMPATVAEETKQAVTTDTVSKTDTGNNTDTPKETFWEKNKSWIKPVGIGVGALGLIFIGIKAFGSKNKASPQGGKQVNGLDGVKRKHKNHYRKNKKSKQKHYRLKTIALK